MNSVSPLHRLFRVLFLIINEISVWAVYRPHYDERILFSNGKNDNSKTMKRVHRDVGILSHPLVHAFLTGIIGMTSRAVSDLTSHHPYPSDGGCQWFGTSPFCNAHCQTDYDYIRNSNGRCSNRWLAGVCKPDPSFGEPCSTIFGGIFKKRFCCKSDPSECSWSGRWMGAFTAHNIYCRYDNHGHCGHLDCSVNHFNYQAHNSTKISGDRCDQISLFGLQGKATCGYIAWFDDNGALVDSWYKSK